MEVSKVVLRFVKLVFRKLIIILVMLIVIFFGLPPFIILVPPMLILRKLVSFLSVIKSDLGKMVSASSSLFAVDDITGKPKCAVVGVVRLKGKLDIDTFKSKIVNKVIGSRKVGRELKNIELKQYPYKWMGFVFWKWDDKFDISNHVKYYRDRINTESKISLEEIKEIEQELLFQSFPAERSPWEVIIFPIVKSDNSEDETVFMLKYHHVLADGFSILKLCLAIADEIPKENIPRPHFAKESFLQRLLFYVRFIEMPYELAECAVESYYHSKWKTSCNNLPQNWIASNSDQICVDVIKETKCTFNTSLNTVIFSALTSAIRKLMLKTNVQIPNHVYASIALPKKGHPDKLRNYALFTTIPLPVGENDPLRRLMNLERTLGSLKHSTLPNTLSTLSVIVGCMFHWMIRPLLTNTIKGALMAGGSSFPGPKCQMTFFGQEAIDMHFALGPLYYGNVDVKFNTLTYNNQFQVRLMVNENILNKKTDVDEMAKDFLEEFIILKRLSNSIV